MTVVFVILVIVVSVTIACYLLILHYCLFVVISNINDSLEAFTHCVRNVLN